MEFNVNHPKHYNSHPSGIECITIARHYTFSIGNAIKYLWRAGLKQDPSMEDREKEIEDLEKAKWYIDDRIATLRGDNSQQAVETNDEISNMVNRCNELASRNAILEEQVKNLKSILTQYDERLSKVSAITNQPFNIT